MQTSDGSRNNSVLNGMATLILTMLLAAVVNSLLTLALVPYGSKSEIAWTDYAAQDDVDCLIVGTSSAMSGIDPQMMGERLDLECFNLATPSQLLDESYLAIKTAYEDHGITHVVLSLSHSQVMRSSNANPGSAFMHQRSRVVDLNQQIEGVSYLLLSSGAISKPTSLNALFPWVSNKVSKSMGAIVKNARMKLDGTSLYQAAEVNEPGWTYQGKGFGYYTKALDYNGSKVQSYFVQDNPEDIGVEAGRAGTLDDDRARALNDLCSYCETHGIELYAIAPPLPKFSIIEYGADYFTLGESLRSFIEERGGHYIDINLVPSDILDFKEEYFVDSTHLNIEGAHAFTDAICKVIDRATKGEDVDSLRVSQSDYMCSIDYISCVFLDSESHEDGIHLTARAMTGPEVDVEYQYLVKSGDEWVVIRDWSSDDSCVYLPEGSRRGEVTVCANARQVGDDVEYERYRIATAMY